MRVELLYGLSKYELVDMVARKEKTNEKLCRKIDSLQRRLQRAMDKYNELQGNASWMNNTKHCRSV